MRRIGTAPYVAAATVIIAAGLWLRAPLLSSGFAIDDFAQLAMMKGVYPVRTPPLQLFTFSSGEPADDAALRSTGFFPWWSHARLRISMFRPLASALMWVDLGLFGENAFAYHVHSAVWWLAMVAVLAALLRLVLPDLAALFALLLFGIDEAHGSLIGWVANRNATVASVFGLLGLWALVRAKAGHHRRLRALAFTSFGLGLLASECALGFLGYAALFELLQAEPGRRTRSVLPVAALGAGYVLARAALGFGSYGSGLYIDPLGEVTTFVPAALRHFPALMADLLFSIHSTYGAPERPIVEYLVEEHWLPPVWLFDLRPWEDLSVLVGWVAFALFALLSALALRRQSSAGRLRWLLLGVPLAVLPSVSSIPGSRLLVPAQLGFCVLLVQLMRTAWSGWTTGRSRVASALGLVAATAFASFHVAMPGYVALVDAGTAANVSNAVRASMLAPELDAVLEPDARAMIVSAADPTTTIYVALVRKLFGRPGPKSCQLLTATFVPVRLTTVSPTAFVLERMAGYYTGGDAYATVFNREPLRKGELFHSGWLSARVEAASDAGPQRVRYEIDRRLDHRQVVLLEQTPSGLHRVAFPPLGQSVTFMPPTVPYELFGR